MATDAQMAANRQNGQLGGVKTEEGKQVSRLNARKHGILVSALTAADYEELTPILSRFLEELRPATAVEEAIVEKIALAYLRLQRCALAEAVYHDATWRTEGRYGFKAADGPRAYFDPDCFERIVTLVGRYDALLTNQFVKLLRELERLQRIRAGEHVPPPLVAEVSVSPA